MSAELTEVWVGDPPERWAALGFAVDGLGRVALGGVTVQLGVPGTGITAWSLPEIDGVAHADSEPAGDAAHPNGAVALDHVVVVTPEFDRTAAAFQAAGLSFRRVRDAGGGVRQGFRRAGPAIVEVVEARDAPPGPARLWGLVSVVEDLDALHARLGSELVGAPKDAVQPGRRIATVRRSAGLSAAMAFITPDP